MKLSIIIVNWNTGDELRSCIASIRSASMLGSFLSDLIVIDNASVDDSLRGLDKLNVNVTIIRNSYNRGFAAACNQGASVCSGDYLLFLNPDTRLFENSLVAPLAFLERKESARIGICGVQLVDDSNRPCLSYARFPGLMNFVFQAIGINNLVRLVADGGAIDEAALREGDVLQVDQVIGAFFIVRRSVFDQLGGFDERFFVYFEEVDFALRARDNGWTSVCLLGTRCIHIGGRSSRQVKAARLFYSLRSRILYAFKHFSALSIAALLFITLTVEFIGRVSMALVRGSLTDCGHVLRAYAMLFGNMPSIIRTSVNLRGK
jgi:N-acetylglucosaminyl-diphospho-decaprenol L-rhamnosyltransferase